MSLRVVYDADGLKVEYDPTARGDETMFRITWGSEPPLKVARAAMHSVSRAADRVRAFNPDRLYLIAEEMQVSYHCYFYAAFCMDLGDGAGCLFYRVTDSYGGPDCHNGYIVIGSKEETFDFCRRLGGVLDLRDYLYTLAEELEE